MSAQSVYEAIAKAAERWPQRPILHTTQSTAEAYTIAAGEQSYLEFKQQADAIADRISNAGYLSGMRVAVLLENRPEFFAIFVALNRLGISIVPINPELRAAELEYLIGHSEPALIIAIENRQQALRTAADTAGMELSVIDPADIPPAPRANAVVADNANGDAREAAVLYTSGTTGNPKGCVLPNAYFLLAGRWYAELGGIVNLQDSGERMITPLPIFHMNAMAYSFMAMVTVGGCLIALDRFHPRSWWSDVANSRATCLHYLGVMPSILMSLDESEHDNQHSIRFGFGAGVDPKLQVDFESRFGFPLVEAWAMTETGAGAVISAHLADRLVAQSCLGAPSGCLVSCWYAMRETIRVTGSFHIIIKTLKQLMKLGKVVGSTRVIS